MSTAISADSIPENIGIKAKNLMLLRQAGFTVPDGIILDGSVYRELIAANGIAEKLTSEFDALALLAQQAAATQQAIAETSVRCQALFEGVTLPSSLMQELQAALDLDHQKLYAVRSSGTAEDLPNFSFAGQYTTTLNVGGLAGIGRAVVACYQSLFSRGVLSYLANNRIRPEEFAMAVVIQEMVNAEISGVAFSVNPLTGNDREMVVELTEGLGDALVSGQVNPDRVVFDWYEGRVVENSGPLDGPLDGPELLGVLETLASVQRSFGYPCDIEFAWREGTLYILQARAITRIMYTGIGDQWTTADFKDGGVSAGVCTAYMWSLYDLVWETAYREFLHKGLLVPRDKLGKLGGMFFGRPYWNLSMAKLGMANVPGYKERDFDSELGVACTYVGDGVTTKLTPGSAINAARILLAHRSMTKERLRENERFRAELLACYQFELEEFEAASPDKDWETPWLDLVFTHYNRSETTYFNQIFINTVGQSIYKDDLVRHLPESEYLNLLIGLQDISHLRPFIDLWEISRTILGDAVALAYWQNTPAETIAASVENGVDFPREGELRRHLATFGYHSNKELDVTYPHYAEDPAPVIRSLRELTALDDSRSPVAVQGKQTACFEAQLGRLKETTRPRTYAKLRTSIDEMRTMLWWREEFRDISTKFYYLIRLYSLKLAAQYADAGVLADAEDFWHLPIEDVRSYIEGRLTAGELRAIAERNKRYYDSFRNFTSENEIGSSFNALPRQAGGALGATGVTGAAFLAGVGAGGGSITGRARVIESLEHIDRLQLDDILVTKFTDTGWTSKFAILKGVVTEYGGILCHAAIVSREYGIPCVVCVNDATRLIADGALIRIDGDTGHIEVLEALEVLEA
jgi:pyruvate,water dikinase